MRICIITPTSSLGVGGGIKTHLRNLTQGLITKDQDVTILTGIQNQYEDTENSIQGAHIVPIRGVYGDTFNPDFWKISRQVFDSLHVKQSFDIVLSEGSSGFGLLLKNPISLPIIGLLHQFRIIHLFNSFLEVDSPRTLGIYGLKTVPKLFYSAITQEIPFYHRCKKIICGADHITRRLIRYYKINKAKIKVIPYWINEDHFKSSNDLREKGRKILNISDQQFTFLILGRIQKTKGVLVGLNAYAKIIKKYPNLMLVIAGGGNDKLLEYYRGTASNLNIEDNTIFTDAVPDNNLPLIYNAADVFIMPSLLTEVLPYTILEAMAVGLPVITTKRPGNYEALGSNGVYVNVNDIHDLANAMERMIIDTSLRTRCSRNNYHRFTNKFTLEILIDKWIDVFHELTSDYPVKR